MQSYDSIIEMLNIDDEKFNRKLAGKIEPFNDNQLKKFVDTITGLEFTNKVLNPHRSSNQIKWNAYSYVLINELADYIQCNINPDLYEIIKFLGKERHEIANELGHSEEFPRRQENKEFGKLRGIETDDNECES